MSSLARLLREASRSFRKRGFAHHVLTLMTGTGAAQAIIIVSTPVLTRLYEPADMGAFGVFFASVMLISSVLGWRYPLAIIQERDDGLAADLLCLSTLITTVMSGLALLVGILGGNVFARSIGSSELSMGLCFFGPCLLATGLAHIWGQWLTRSRDFHAQALSRFVGAAVTAGAQIGYGIVMGSTAVGLILSFSLGRLVSAIILGIRVRSLAESTQLGFRGISACARMLKRYRAFALFSTPGILFNRSVADVPAMLLAAYYGAGTAGCFAVAQRVLIAPISMVSEAVSQVFHERLARNQDSAENAPRLVLGVFLSLFAIITPPMICLALIAPRVFEWLLGPDWGETGMIVAALSPMYAMKFAVTPVTRTSLVFERQAPALIWQLLFALCSLGILSVAARHHSAPASLLMYSLTGTFMYAAILALSVRWASSGNRCTREAHARGGCKPDDGETLENA